MKLPAIKPFLVTESLLVVAWFSVIYPVYAIMIKRISSDHTRRSFGVFPSASSRLSSTNI